jgi:hypothetical protein
LSLEASQVFPLGERRAAWPPTAGGDAAWSRGPPTRTRAPRTATKEVAWRAGRDRHRPLMTGARRATERVALSMARSRPTRRDLDGCDGVNIFVNIRRLAAPHRPIWSTMLSFRRVRFAKCRSMSCDSGTVATGPGAAAVRELHARRRGRFSPLSAPHTPSVCYEPCLWARIGATAAIGYPLLRLASRRAPRVRARPHGGHPRPHPARLAVRRRSAACPAA